MSEKPFEEITPTRNAVIIEVIPNTGKALISVECKDENMRLELIELSYRIKKQYPFKRF